MTPPPVARWLLRRSLRSADREFFLDDLGEEFARRLDADGAIAARRWYWRQTVHSLLPLMRQRFRAPSRHSHSPSSGGASIWRDVMDDIRYSFRLSRRNPIASAAIIGTMILGVGATTAVFSVVHAVLLKPLPFAESGRVVRFGSLLRGRELSSAYPDLLDIRRGVGAFEVVSGVSFGSMTLQRGSDPRLLPTAQVDEEYARLFAILPLAGRLFDAGDVQPGAPSVAVLTFGFWNEEFGGDPGVLGQSITFDNEAYQIIGILPRQEFAYPGNRFAALTPLKILPGSPRERRGNMWLTGIAKVRRDVSVSQALGELRGFTARLAEEHSATNEEVSAWLAPLRDLVVGDIGSMLLLLAVSVGTVLLIACANIANILLGQANTRAREFAVRAAIGGGAGRLTRQVLTESLVLAAVGGGLGIVLGPVLIQAIVAVYPSDLPRAGEIGLDLRVLGVAVAVTILAGILAGIPTVRRAGAGDLVRKIREGGRAGYGRSRFGGVLIAGQVAASLVLVFAAALLLRTLSQLLQADPGFDPRGVLTFQLSPSPARHPGPEGAERFFSTVTEGLGSFPGVQTVTSSTQIPFGSGHWGDVIIDEQQGDRGVDNPKVQIVWAGPTYARTLGLTVLRGRGFAPTDGPDAPPVVVVNEALARQVYPGQDPIGRRMMWNGKPGWQIVGVLKSTHQESLYDQPPATVFVPMSQMPRRSRYVAVRSGVPPADLLLQTRALLRTVDPTVAITDAAPMEERVGSSLAAQRFRAILVGGFGLLALVLAVVGIYGVVAYTVSAQTREIGIRMALGEDRSRIRLRVVSSALRIALVGTIVGIGASIGVGRWLSAFLVGVDPRDPLILLVTGSVLLTVTALASYLPAREASQVDPMAALRSD